MLTKAREYEIVSYRQSVQQKGMLLVLPVPLRAKGKQIFLESQACNGLEQWANNFGSVVVAAPLLPEALATEGKTMTWRDTATLAGPHRFEFVPLPWAYSLPKFLSNYPSVRASLGELISRCRYLQFAIGGLFGDWAAVAALEAHKQGRPYSIHTDRVEHEVMLRSRQGATLKTRLKSRAMAPLIASYHKQIIKNCALGLWHGQDCYSAYSPFCQNSHLIHDIHTKPSDSIGNLELFKKARCAKSDETIRICYAGRIDPMKAPLDWVKAVGRARDLGVNLHATWMGDGSLMTEMKAMIAEMGLSSVIELTGFESDRKKVFKKISESHLMLFTHVTPESPRCLIESLVRGTPIIGYHSDYADDLVNNHGGGMFVPVENWEQLGNLIAQLSNDRERLSTLIQEAGKNGTRFNDQAVFHERSELIKKHLA
ncbi:glycosyltransferase [Allocoleopsis franciscana]|uniref:Glycosyltransferase n=1 Tax=Allocoleopsis franciscana PCC 7113 TaxID=1173027 RepID=K9WGC8_9CYAN|nr:glycosyltransferase [Allocoleopsis franciscana]AFZ19460.1 glycosyltransferase [Allocoleopsis franciscana PCC 7113]